MRTILAGLALLLTVAACGDSTGPDTDDVTGTYALQSVGGKPLPAVVDEQDGATVEFLSGTMTISEGSRWSTQAMLRITEGTSVVTVPGTGGGTWRWRGSTLMLTDAEDGTEYETTRTRDSITLVIDGVALVWAR
jgi:hypothetical protein